ncbi:MAG: glycine dehydrogenase, partial [Candidatus Dormibacteraeota bacterium]|nr:glycine dehydrogenase [Candidatus Dormibacteraeota bacterium]
MPYLVHADPERAAMLAAVGADTVDDLLVDVPAALRLQGLELADGLSELDTVREITRLAERNHVYPDRLTFRGAGVYRRYVPAAVQAVTQKPEFYTAYTPYQPEASQGTLQAIFEYQTLIAELTGLDASNASLYDGATAAAEAVIMAGHATGRRRVVVAPGLHPEYLEVLRCYGDGRGFSVDERLDELDD